VDFRFAPADGEAAEAGGAGGPQVYQIHRYIYTDILAARRARTYVPVCRAGVNTVRVPHLPQTQFGPTARLPQAMAGWGRGSPSGSWASLPAEEGRPRPPSELPALPTLHSVDYEGLPGAPVDQAVAGACGPIIAPPIPLRVRQEASHSSRLSTERMSTVCLARARFSPPPPPLPSVSGHD
jgi:hypothetical protein